MGGEWVRAGGKAGEPIVFEAGGKIESLRRGKRVAYPESSGTGAVAVFRNAKNECTICWIIKGGLLKQETIGALVPGGIERVGTLKNGSAVIVYRVDDNSRGEMRELRFSGLRAAGFVSAVSAAAKSEDLAHMSRRIVDALALDGHLDKDPRGAPLDNSELTNASRLLGTARVAAQDVSKRGQHGESSQCGNFSFWAEKCRFAWPVYTFDSFPKQLCARCLRMIVYDAEYPSYLLDDSDTAATAATGSADIWAPPSGKQTAAPPGSDDVERR